MKLIPELEHFSITEPQEHEEDYVVRTVGTPRSVLGRHPTLSGAIKNAIWKTSETYQELIQYRDHLKIAD